MNTIELEIYITENGKSPYVKWMGSLSERLNNKVTRRLANVKLGNFGDVKPIKGVRGLYEMRIHEGPGYRIYTDRVSKIGFSAASKQRNSSILNDLILII